MSAVIFTALASGFGLGFFVAAQVGPVWLLCVRSVLRGRLLTGLGIGLGAAIIDVAYAALGVAGVTQLLRITQVRLALGLAGAAVLLAIGARTLWAAFRIRSGLETSEEIISAGRAFRTALIATASNPLTIVSWGGRHLRHRVHGPHRPHHSCRGRAAGRHRLRFVRVVRCPIRGHRDRAPPRGPARAAHHRCRIRPRDHGTRRRAGLARLPPHLILAPTATGPPS